MIYFEKNSVHINRTSQHLSADPTGSNMVADMKVGFSLHLPRSPENAAAGSDAHRSRRLRSVCPYLTFTARFTTTAASNMKVQK